MSRPRLATEAERAELAAAGWMQDTDEPWWWWCACMLRPSTPGGYRAWTAREALIEIRKKPRRGVGVHG